MVGRTPFPARTSVSGFTLVELLVVLAIIGVISAVVLNGEGNFNRTFLLTNTNYDVALSYRTAQSYGLASQQYAGTLNAGYGIHLGAPPLTNYILFADIYPDSFTNATRKGQVWKPNIPPGDGLYDSAAELVQTYTLTSGFTISDYCGTQTGGNHFCASANIGAPYLDIVFTRPNEKPTIWGALNGVPLPYAKACLTVRSPAGSTQYVTITETGEVATSDHCL